jgi:hypothetical protein
LTLKIRLGKGKREKGLNQREGKRMANNKGSSERELIDTGNDKRYVRRDEQGQFEQSDDVGRSLSQDVKRDAKTQAPWGAR